MITVVRRDGRYVLKYMFLYYSSSKVKVNVNGNESSSTYLIYKGSNLGTKRLDLNVKVN